MIIDGIYGLAASTPVPVSKKELFGFLQATWSKRQTSKACSIDLQGRARARPREDPQ